MKAVGWLDHITRGINRNFLSQKVQQTTGNFLPAVLDMAKSNTTPKLSSSLFLKGKELG